MPANLNRSKVKVDFKDVYGNTITDHVVIKIYNTRLQSEKQSFPVDFQGAPVILPEKVAAFPTGLAQMFIQPERYRFKQRFINVEAGGMNNITEYFFVDPDQAQPRSISFADLPQKSYSGELLRILGNSGIDQAVWDGLDPRNQATILNLSAKMSREKANGRTLITFVDSVDRTWLDTDHRERIYARVNADLLNALRGSPEVYFSVNGGMHHFPPNNNWKSVKPPDSFKTLRDSAGNIQLTFARNEAGELLADIDIDDHKGLQHVADVLKHVFSGKETDPYDIHEILMFSQQLDAEYRLI